MVILKVVTPIYVQIGKNLQLSVTVLLKVSHFLDDVTKGTVHRVNVLQMQTSATLVLYSGSETLAYRRTVPKSWVAAGCSNKGRDCDQWFSSG